MEHSGLEEMGKKEKNKLEIGGEDTIIEVVKQIKYLGYILQVNGK